MMKNIVGLKKSCERNLKSQTKTFIGNDPSIARAVKHSYRCFDTSVLKLIEFIPIHNSQFIIILKATYHIHAPF
jgi:hypothetical protein